ncbi:MAG: hypothetical protein R3E92_24815, partial [Burkholderiaceae bacterium]
AVAGTAAADGFEFLGAFDAMESDRLVGANLDNGNRFSITRCVQHLRGKLLTQRTPFCNEVWPMPIAAVVREVDRE